MAYYLKAVTVRADNGEEGVARIGALWGDVLSGALPVLCDSARQPLEDVCPVARYSSYESDERGAYDFSIVGVPGAFFGELERAVQAGRCRKIEAADSDVAQCTRKAWEAVWAAQGAGTLRRAFTEDYEVSTPPEYAPDGRAHCALYIVVRE